MQSANDIMRDLLDKHGKPEVPEVLTGLRPRQYAEQIIKERSKEKRRELLAAVPESCRDRVELYVTNAFGLRRAARSS